ncbi:hypothetical protein EV138_5300 [Kribbella voronezhensis]|uniref:Tfp pilus assembly protein PilX n=1 Tax=Kribbella voronezhensis TaxID=2512212 RepID=A0A4R7TIC3_9ACTN|nr:hypothetical protein [Kribbella voronezhensis]TDU91689.1 hypothetical protein EV138_5300 [Kribbella voronezhensis]
MRRRRRDEHGASLLLVLVVISVVAVALSALLTRADSAQKVTAALREQAFNSYTADGALQAAVNNLRNSSYNGESGQHCFGLSDTLSLPTFTPARNLLDLPDSAAVTCTADPKQVVVQCAGSDCNRPDNAILTVGRVPGEDGISIDQPADSTLRIHGDVFSNSTVDVSAGQLSASGGVSARGLCSGTLLGTAVCNLGLGTLPAGDDPGYSSVLTSAPVHRNLPTCTTANSVVTFLPGYYDDAVGLSRMMKADSPCHGSTWWFKPGAYYFDFHNTANPLLDTGSHVWTVDDGNLVAGTPVNASGAPLATPPVPAVIPGACASPLTGATGGVQFVFGGDSRLVIGSGRAELCGSYSSSKPPVALYGLTSGDAAVTDRTGASALTPTTVSLLTPFLLTATPSRLSTVDGVAATWKSTKVDDSAVLPLSGFAAGAVPTGSVLESAALKITHRHKDPATTDKLAVSVDVGSGQPLSVTAGGLPGGSAYGTETLPLDAARTGSLAAAIYAGTFTGASLTLTAGLAVKDDVEDIDAVRLELTYTPPALRKASGCVVDGPYDGSGSACALVRATGRFSVAGTVYAPAGAVDLTIDSDGTGFRAGGVVRALKVAVTGKVTGVPFDLPDDSPGFSFALHLKAYVCPRSVLCLPSGRPALQAKIGLVDADPSSPVPGRRKVTVLAWWRPG